MACPCLCYTFTVKGHPNIKATHRSTLELTADEHLTPRGDCIVGVSAPHGTLGLPETLKDGIRRGWRVCLTICTEKTCDTVCGWGDPRLALDDPSRIIVRKSSYTEPATLMVRASKSARELDRRLVKELADGAVARVVITVYPP